MSSQEELLILLALYDSTATPILIHCLGGADRTGEASALWVIEKQKMSKSKGKKQLSIKYGHRKFVNSAKDYLIEIWQGREWLMKSYNPKN